MVATTVSIHLPDASPHSQSRADAKIHTQSFGQHEASKPSAPNNQAIGAINRAAESTVEVPLRNRALCTALLHPDKASDVMRCALNLKPIYTEALSKALPPYSPGPSSTKTQNPDDPKPGQVDEVRS